MNTPTTLIELRAEQASLQVQIAHVQAAYSRLLQGLRQRHHEVVAEIARLEAEEAMADPDVRAMWLRVNAHAASEAGEPEPTWEDLQAQIRNNPTAAGALLFLRDHIARKKAK